MNLIRSHREGLSCCQLLMGLFFKMSIWAVGCDLRVCHAHLDISRGGTSELEWPTTRVFVLDNSMGVSKSGKYGVSSCSVAVDS